MSRRANGVVIIDDSSGRKDNQEDISMNKGETGEGRVC